MIRRLRVVLVLALGLASSLFAAAADSRFFGRPLGGGNYETSGDVPSVRPGREAAVWATSLLLAADGVQARGGQPAGRGGRGGRGAIRVMALTSPAWPDGGTIPIAHTQVGEEISPPLAWDNVPDETQSFVLIVHDINTAIGDGTADLLHWMLWNIPAATRSLPAGVPQGSELPDGTRQISASGPYYRGPGAPASGPPHHYVFELFALDTTLDDVPAVGASPPATRAAVMKAMAGHVRGKGVYVGLFRRGS